MLMSNELYSVTEETASFHLQRILSTESVIYWDCAMVYWTVICQVCHLLRLSSVKDCVIYLGFSSHLSLNRKGCWCTTDDFTTSFLHFPLFSTALWDLPNSRPVHSLLSSHLFLSLPCLLPPFTVPCTMVLARPDERETWPYHCSLHLFVVVRKPSCGPVADTDNKIATKSVNWISGVWLDQSSDCSGPPGQVLASTPLGFTCPTSVTMMD